MLKPQMPNLPGVGAVADTLDFVKNLWGSMSVPGMNLPGMAAPTLSVDELDKKIADLKAVESWLNVNVAMLRGTIQALEVQRGTIATLKSMGATLANAVKQPGANEKSVLAAAPYASAFFAQPAVEPVAKVESPPEPKLAAPAPTPEAPAPARDEPAKDSAANPMANPAAWWNMLQDQFKQAVSTAMSSDAMASAQDAANKLADSNPALKLGKAMVNAAVKAPAKEVKAAAKPAAKKAPAKRAAAKPKAGKAG
ncbi:MAG: PhaM family polyhydroxyalkanoate granule multifunctional regulatory protein [Pseudomonadota bacterium]